MIYTITLNPALDRELTVPEIQFDQVLRATELRIDFGGKGLNVSRALRAMGTPSTALGWIGGATGKQISDGLNRLGIATDFVEIAGETRTNVSIVSSGQTRYIKVNESGPTITLAERDALLAKIKRLAHAGDWWVLSGNLPPGVPSNFYAEIIQHVQAAGARTVLDTSGEPLKCGCAARPYLIKPNAHEAAELTGIEIRSPHQARDAVMAILNLGAQNIFLSFGKLGALFCDGRQTWFAAAPKIEEQNPIGAGDCTVAGWVWALNQNLSPVDALRWGVAAGSAAASLPGTAVGDHALVASLVEQVQAQVLG